MTVTADSSAPDTTARLSTTRRTLLRVLGGLLVVTGLVLATSLAVVSGTHRTAETIRTQDIPSILELAAVRTALVRADTAAIDSFQSQQARLAGPGEEYQNQIAAASQSLAQAAEDIGAGAGSSRRIQLVEGLLVTYIGLMGQADAHFRKSGSGGLAPIYLWYASRLLHSPDVGILAQLDGLLQDASRALRARLSSGWLSRGATLIWAVPVLILLVLLVRTQLFLRRRFRRRINGWLAAATVILVVLAAGASFALVSKQQLVDAEHKLSQVREDSEEQFDGIEREGQRALAELVTSSCPGPEGSCGVTVDDFRHGLADEPVPSPVPDNQVSDDSRAVNEQAVSGTSAASGALVVLFAASPIILLVWLGLRPRIEEYRYRSR